MFFAIELQTSGVYVSPHTHGLRSSKHLIRVRKIALHGEDVFFRCAKAPRRTQLGLSHEQRLFVVVCSV